jgi:hypothetical protein
MEFRQYEDGSADIVFSWKERFTLFFKGKIFFKAVDFKHFGNNLIHLVSQWNMKFNDKVQRLNTKSEKVKSSNATKDR